MIASVPQQEIADKINEARCRRLIHQAISTFELDLSGHVVLTEAATGYYVLTPLIAALAGASRVYALTKDSRYGRAEDVREITKTLAQRWGVDRRIEVILSREDPRISNADIVTNLGFVRPLNAPFLRCLKQSVVIPLMFEAWEYRPEDLDLEECRKLGIPVLGTNEHHPDLQILQYVGHLALKLLFELDVEVLRSNVVVLGGGEFSKCVTTSLKNAGATVTQIRVAEGDSLGSPVLKEALSTCDAIVVAEDQSRETLIGQDGHITFEELRRMNPAISIAHIAGGVNHGEAAAASIPCRPDHFAPPGYMSVTTDYLGPRPLIDLHTAGLRVGQVMVQAVQQGYRGTSAEERACQLCPLAQRFR